MAKVYASVVIDAPASAVWSKVRNFDNVATWHPSIRSCDIDDGRSGDTVGCVRSIVLSKDGSSMREQLLCLSDFDYTCVYCVLETSLPVDNCVAKLHLTPITDGDRTFAEWSADFDSNQEKEVSDILSQDFLQSGLDSLRAGFLNT